MKRIRFIFLTVFKELVPQGKSEKTSVAMIKLLIKRRNPLMPLCLFSFMIIVAGCANRNRNIIKELKIGLRHNNRLQIQIDVFTSTEAEVYAEYWPDSSAAHKLVSPVSKKGLSHSLVLLNIVPNTSYSFQVVTVEEGVKNTSKEYQFQSGELPMWLQEQFKASVSAPELLPGEFKEGFMLLNKRETPGIAYIVDYKGRLRWYHMVDGTGFKVIHFTQDTSIISILGKSDEPTSYGSEILEINLSGDTLLHLKKGQGDFTSTIHHEILKKNKDEIVTLFVDRRIMDLGPAGGSKKDTVNGDGILIMDRNGKKIWQWSVFDVLNPFDDPQLLKNKKDWMHANSLNYDKDSNYLISFYNNGQIWKIHSRTGQIMWKMGRGGNIALPAECDFTQTHAVHINPQGSIMFFDNGVAKQQSKVFALDLDEAKQAAQTSLYIKLPQEIYNDRMGSAYMVNDTTVLCCSSKRHIAVLANTKGVLLWTLDTAVPPYRVEFIAKEKLFPFIAN
jgi:arylsulfate sulfotransferase